VWNWQQASSYGFEPKKTVPEQWAGEFLRRNRNFQKECDDPVSQKLSGVDSWNSRWGLEKKKHYQLPYVPESIWDGRMGNGRRVPVSPVWAITQPEKFIDGTKRVNGPDRNKGPQDCPLKLGKNQVAVVFNLYVGSEILCLIHPDLLDMQVKNTHAKLKLHRCTC